MTKPAIAAAPKYAKLIAQTVKENSSELFDAINEMISNDIGYSEEMAEWFASAVGGKRDFKIYRDGGTVYIVTDVKREGYPDYDDIIKQAARQAKVDEAQIRSRVTPQFFDEHFWESVNYEIKSSGHEINVVGRSGGYWGLEWDSSWVEPDDKAIKGGIQKISRDGKALSAISEKMANASDPTEATWNSILSYVEDNWAPWTDNGYVRVAPKAAQKFQDLGEFISSTISDFESSGRWVDDILANEWYDARSEARVLATLDNVAENLERFGKTALATEVDAVAFAIRKINAAGRVGVYDVAAILPGGKLQLVPVREKPPANAKGFKVITTDGIPMGSTVYKTWEEAKDHASELERAHSHQPFASRVTAKSGATLDPRTLDEFVKMAAESSEIENHRSAQATDEVEREAAKYERELPKVLQEWVKHHPLAEGYDADDLLNSEGAFLVLMTLRGEGVGIWDGSWDEFFTDTKEIKELQKFLHQKLGKFSDGTGGGSLEDAFQNAAFESTGTDMNAGVKASHRVTAGYTHYWRPQRDFTDEEWAKIAAGAKKIIQQAGKKGIGIAGGNGIGRPTIDNSKIVLNGNAHETYETFYLTKQAKGEFEFCKTAQKPYDAVVVSILALAEKVAPGALELSSDGGAGVFNSPPIHASIVAMLDRVAEVLEKRDPVLAAQIDQVAKELHHGDNADAATPNQPNVLNWMKNNVSDCVDPKTGEVNTTQLAENAAHEFDHDEWLDQETHWVWDMAVKAAEWQAKQ